MVLIGIEPVAYGNGDYAILGIEVAFNQFIHKGVFITEKI